MDKLYRKKDKSSLCYKVLSLCTRHWDDGAFGRTYVVIQHKNALVSHFISAAEFMTQWEEVEGEDILPAYRS